MTAVGADDRTARAQARVDPDRVAELCCALVDVPSPPGDEAALAGLIVSIMRELGLQATTQPLDDRQANAWGSLETGPAKDGPTVMLYAPIDTMTTGDPAIDLPHVGDRLADHHRPKARRVDGRVVGLGAMNPKGHAACILAAAEALVGAGVRLDGRLVLGFGAGGMPTNGVADPDGVVRRRDIAHGRGCAHLLDTGPHVDAAIIAKSGWAVSWEEVGLAWFEIVVRGIHTYVGSRHLLDYRNAIADAARLTLFLEQWLSDRAQAQTAGHVAPQGIVAAVQAGWWEMLAFTPAAARLRVDVRLAPGQSPEDARVELVAALAGFTADDPGWNVEVIPLVGIPGTRTDEQHWIVQAAVRAWEAETGAVHEATVRTSGATDANILRAHGVPTARVGLPKASLDGQPLDFAAGMNTVDVEALEAFTRFLVRVAIAATDERVLT